MSTPAPRNRVLPPLLLSVLLHLLLGVWLWSTEPSSPPARPMPTTESSTVEVEFREAPASVPGSPLTLSEARPPPTRAVPRTERRQKKAGPIVTKSPPLPPEPMARPPEPLASGSADVTDVPQAPILVPSWMQTPAATGSLAATPGPRGRTLRPGDPELRPESNEETSERLTAQAQTWLDDDMAGVRAQGIGGHPYLGEMRDSLEGALGNTTGGKPKELGIHNPIAGLLKNYTEAAEQYGQTGSPGITPPSTPLHSEQLAARFRDDAPGRKMIASAQALETLEALESRGALLTAQLELRHSPTGALLGSRLTESSGNHLFDAFVLKVVPASLGALKPPPPEVMRNKEELKTRWLVEGWHHPPKGLSQSIASSLASGQLMLLPLGLLTSSQGEEAEFEYRVRLNKLY